MSIETDILIGLVRRGVPQDAAKGMVANMVVESGLNPGINEVNPVVEGSRGGYGLNQWTGPRRVDYERFAKSRGSRLDDFDTQLDFTLHELNTTESRAKEKLYAAKSATDAARIYSENFLRPGIPHMDRRLAEAERIQGANALSGTQPSNALALQRPAQQNILALQGQLDPRDFMTSRYF